LNIQVNMFKNHLFAGYGFFQTSATTTAYTPFIININYNDTIIPDSAHIGIQLFIKKPLGNSVLYIDNLNFDGFLPVIETPYVSNPDGGFDFNVYPNPLSERAKVSFTVSNDEHVTVRLFDLSGKQVAVIADRLYKAGQYNLDLSASGLNKGFYICVINTKNSIDSRKLIIY
jgi:hypothetical protein